MIHRRLSYIIARFLRVTNRQYGGGQCRSSLILVESSPSGGDLPISASGFSLGPLNGGGAFGPERVIARTLLLLARKSLEP